MKRESIGLVMALTPRYSETFLSSKIRGLTDDGFDVRVFVSSGQRAKRTYPALPIDRSRKIRSAILSIWAWCSLMLLRPNRVIRFAGKERELGRGWVRILQGLALFQHVLMHARPGWLHFEFASLTIGAESLASAIDAKMGVSLRGHDITSFPLKHPGCYDQLWRRVDQVHAISDDLIHAAHFVGMPESVKVTKIPPAVDTAFFDRASCSCMGRDDSDAIQILTVARLHWKKGLDYMLVALKVLSQRSPDFNWRFTIVGCGGQEERLRFSVAELGLEDRVVFTGKCAPPLLREKYAQSDIYVQSSLQEGFCNAALEAQSMELTCIVSDAEGLQENVGSFGVVVPKRKPEMLAAELAKIMHQPKKERQRIGRLARQRVIAEFDLTKQRGQFRQFFKSIAE
ncbi:MAG: colanic acid/amylovoran biosynthesis glycosyltransferase [Verrucomicrobiales bacterium]|jgi:colanic acid/amylovoran biosynthesis glycosyltransferase